MSECKHGVESFSAQGCYNCVIEENAALKAELEKARTLGVRLSDLNITLAEQRDTLSSRVKELEDENAKLKLLRDAHGVIALLWEKSAITEEQWIAHLAKREKDAMDAGYAEGVTHTEARAGKRIAELEGERDDLKKRNENQTRLMRANPAAVLQGLREFSESCDEDLLARAEKAEAERDGLRAQLEEAKETSEDFVTRLREETDTANKALTSAEAAERSNAELRGQVENVKKNLGSQLETSLRRVSEFRQREEELRKAYAQTCADVREAIDRIKSATATVTQANRPLLARALGILDVASTPIALSTPRPSEAKATPAHVHKPHIGDGAMGHVWCECGRRLQGERPSEADSTITGA